MPERHWPFATPGIADAEFIRLEGLPMTREEVRVVTISKAGLASGQTVYDIGAGTGSLSVEAARFVFPGQVYAVEANPEAAALVRANARAFGLENVQVVTGLAPEVLASLPRPDRVMVGGNRGHLAGILAVCWEKMLSGGLIVVNAVTLGTLTTALAEFHRLQAETEAWELEVGQMQRLGGQNHAFRHLTRVYIIRGKKGDACAG
ncbi:MAG: precorrin-6Y C5,15-methyltransferase (decarboxylating) subunit CbiT [Clostridia bacterium]|nr:MAG: precorrin-6Y C5,15-methyltransferase (decarboxylating) subunit CbiT [Clostridia bacterium]